MAYITPETVKGMRNELKVLFPVKDGWKLSVTCRNYSTVSCNILEAPIELRNDPTRTNESVNNYWIDTHYKDKEEAKEILLKINAVLNQKNYNNSDVMTDYFDVGHYVSIGIGAWDKPFNVIKK
jgi:hypothetical protein